MVGGLSADTEPIFDSIDIHADFLDFGFMFENFSRSGRGISGDWIVYANDFKRFSLSSCSSKSKSNIARGRGTLNWLRQCGTAVPSSVPVDDMQAVSVQACL